MDFPSLSILVTLACSVAAPLSASPVTNGITDKLENLNEAHTNVGREVPAAPPPPLVVALT